MDQVGNWDGFNQGVSGVLNQTRTHNRVNEITDISNASGQPIWIDPAYDDAGNMTLTPRPNDATNGFTLIYDAWNRIAGVETTDSTPKLVAKYAYDGRNHRINKELYDITGSLESTVKFFYNAAWQCLEERETPVGGSSSTSTYVWGQRYIDELVCRDDASDRLYALQDRQFKTIALTNTSGSVKERYNYTPYGETSFYDSIFALRSASAFDWVYLYTGRRLDPDTGLYCFRNRYYDPSLGRFCSRDPIEFHSDQMSSYELVFGSPLSYVDPLGLIGCRAADDDYCVERCKKVKCNLKDSLGIGKPRYDTGKCTLAFYVVINNLKVRRVSCSCDLKFLGPPGDCPKSFYNSLKRQVEIACNKKDGKDQLPQCSSSDSEKELMDKRDRLIKCAESRLTMTKACFRGGNKSHRDAIRHVVGKAKECRNYLGPRRP